MSNLTIRSAVQQDVQAVLQMMRELAEFEGYHQLFNVSADTVENIIAQRNDIGVLVAAADNSLVGLLVYFYQPFTYDLKPWMVIKEFYIKQDARRAGVGQALFNEAVSICCAAGGSKIKWEVLTENASAQQFYTAMGAQLENDWRVMSIKV